MTKTLYVTSFNETMFRLSGQRLIDSFLRYGIDQDGDLLCTVEGFHLPTDGNPSILQYDLDNSKFLQQWTEKYSYLIPSELNVGGSATPENYPKAYNRWNYRAALWFRKIAALQYALETYAPSYKRIVWIDSDCTWTQPFPSEFWKDFDRHRCLYHYGPIRDRVGHGIESGLLVFNPTGYYILERVFKMYLDGAFQGCKRWDDGWIFKKVILKEPKGCVDLVRYPLPKGVKTETEVIMRGPFRDYVRHEKGRHTFLFQ